MCSRLSWCWQPLVALMMTISMQLQGQQQNVQLVKNKVTTASNALLVKEIISVNIKNFH